MERLFTIDEARRLLPAVKAKAAELIPLRADLAERAQALRAGERSQLPEVKGLEARVAEIVDWFAGEGLEVKGVAPLLLDFPMERDGRRILLCWLENEPELAWYHLAEHGFLGRRPLVDLDVF